MRMKISIFFGILLSFLLTFQPEVFAQPIGKALSDTARLTLFKIQSERTLRRAVKDDLKLPAGSVLLSPDFSQFTRLSEPSTARYFSFDLPISASRTLPIVLEEVSILGNSFSVTTSSGKGLTLPTLRFYRGKVAGDESSTVSMTSTADGLEGLVYGEGFSYTLGGIDGQTAARTHAVYATAEQPSQPEFQCESTGIMLTDSSGAPPGQVPGVPISQGLPSDCRKVRVYFEVDYLLYQQLGSNAATVATQVASLFSDVAAVYANEGVSLEMGSLKIWDTADPYAAATNSLESLTLFRQYWRNRANSFNGDMAHLLSGKNIGGIASFYYRRNNPQSVSDLASVFAIPSYRDGAYGMSGVTAEFGGNIGWGVKLVAHEIGHNFGLPHAHSCLWEGGPIDNCATREGNCQPGPNPQGGTGTIMSYCSIDLNKGFGPQPSAKLKYEFLVGEALLNPGLNPPVVSPQNATILQGQSVTLMVSNCAGTLVWSDGAVTTGNRTVTPIASTVYAASCLVDGCQSAPAASRVTVTCTATVACAVAAPRGMSRFFGISDFTLSTIITSDFYGSPFNLGSNYEDLSCSQSPTLESGSSYPFSLACTFGNSAHAKVYIDYNGDGIFSEQTELAYSSNSAKTTHTGNITPPATATRNVPLRMRVLLDPNVNLSACTLPGNSSGSGKANDYAVTITGAVCPPGVRETVKSGDWNDPEVWSCGTLPVLSDLVKVNQSHIISLPTGYVAKALSIDLLGAIQYGTNASVQLNQP